MKDLDDDIELVERRLALRRKRLEATAREAGQCAKRKLASPPVLIGVTVAGFIVGGLLFRRPKEPHYPDRRRNQEGSAAKKTGFAGLLMTGAMWVIKQQFGNPAAIAQLLLSRMKPGGKPAAPKQWSPRGDSRVAQIYR